LNRKWDDLQGKALDRQKELEDALRDAQAFAAEIQDLLHWLNDVDGALSTTKPVGGLPETAAEQLARFMVSNISEPVALDVFYFSILMNFIFILGNLPRA